MPTAGTDPFQTFVELDNEVRRERAIDEGNLGFVQVLITAGRG
jgi:hypothetical protein